MFKEVMTSLAPPLLLRLCRRLRAPRTEPCGLSGDYRSFAEALARSGGYDSGIILEKTRKALLEVKEGRAAFERDTVLFGEPDYCWPLLSALMWVAAQQGGRLNVLDYGGSLGSSYFQHRLFLDRLPELRWNIVEQPAHVAAGRQWFQDRELRFYAGIEQCLAETSPNVVLLGSVLQYLEEPRALLRQIMALPCDHLVLDRTPFYSGAADRICVQQVPASIYSGSYPCWIFSLERFEELLGREWELLAQFDNTDSMSAPVPVRWQGMILARRSRSARGAGESGAGDATLMREEREPDLA